MHVARSIDQYVTQMHDEMAKLGEGGTVEMDMGVQILFLDGREAVDGKGPTLFGSRCVYVGVKWLVFVLIIATGL